MDVVVFSAKAYDRRFLAAANAAGTHRLRFLEARLADETSALAAGSQAVCIFVNDVASGPVLADLAKRGVRLIALRAAGFNNVDLAVAGDLGLTVARVPAYSPHAIAEHTLALILTLNRRIHRAFNRVREGNFSLDGLLGFDLNGKVAGIVGTGKIGEAVARILIGFGCEVVAFDPQRNPAVTAMGVRYVDFDDLLAHSDLITLHCPLTPATHHLIDVRAVSRMKRGVMLINTSRGAVVDTRAVIRGLKDGRIGGVGLDVYEEEGDLFFEDLSQHFISDDVFARLLTFPNVLITGHQGFFTEEAMTNIAETTLANISAFEQTGHALHEVTAEKVVRAS